MTSRKKISPHVPAAVAILTTAGTFIVDILTPLGITEWIFYIIPTITTYWIKRDHISWIAAAVCSVLILAGILLSPSGNALHLSVINRTAWICLLWIFAYIVYLAKIMEKENARHVANLERTQRELRNVLERISDGFVAFDTEMNYTYVNRHGGTMLGRTPEELTGKNYWKEYPEARGTPFANAYLKAMETQAPIMIDEHYEPWDRWFENRIYPSPEGLSIFFTDITERKRGENKLRENEARLRLSVSAANVGLWDWDLKTNRVYYSPEWKNQIGYRDDEISNDFSEWENRVHPDDLQPTLAKVQAFVANPKGKHEAEFRFRHKDGSYRWIYTYADVIRGEDNKPLRMLGCHIDITGRKRVESLVALESQVLGMVAQQEPLAQILERISLNIEALAPETIASILLLDPDGVHVHYGASPHLPDSYNRAIEGAPIGPVAGSCGTAAYRKEPVIVTDIATDPLWENYRDLILPHGLRACWSIPIINKQGRVLGTFAMYYREPRSPKPEDFELIEFVTHLALITLERKRAEEEVRKNQELFENTFHTSPISTVLTQLPAGIVIDVNDNFKQTFGYLKTEILGRPDTDFDLWDDHIERKKVAEMLVREGRIQGYEFKYRTKSGKVGYGLFYSEVFGQYEEKYVLTKVVDITERKEAEEELRHSREQLRALTGHLQNVIEEERARIAREIHDDIGQIFTAIKMNLALFSQTIDAIKEQKQKKEIAQEIDALIGLLDHGVRSIRKIVRDLRPEVLETMGLLAGIQWQVNEFQKRTKITVTLNLQKITQTLDKHQTVALFRIVQESLTNVARHAAATSVSIELISTPSDIRLKISDNGKGVPDSIFTSPSSFGILAMRERIAALGGTFSITGKAGEGTVVEAVLNQKT